MPICGFSFRNDKTKMNKPDTIDKVISLIVEMKFYIA